MGGETGQGIVNFISGEVFTKTVYDFSTAVNFISGNGEVRLS
jgi:hypothetical protein